LIAGVYQVASINMSLARNAWRSASLVITGLIGVALTAAAIHPVIREPLRLYSEARSEKFYILDHSPGTDTVAAFGSSRIHFGFDPETFDREMGTRGHPETSINLAIYGGSQTEQRAMAREFLRDGSSGNKCSNCVIMFEYNAGGNLQPENLINPRAINLYNFDTAQFAINYSGPEVGRLQRAERAAYAVVGELLHGLNVGMLSNAVFKPPLNQKLLADFTDDGRRGRTIASPRKQDELAVEDFCRQHPRPPVAAMPELVPPGAHELLADTTQAAPGRQVRYIYIVSPLVNSLEEMKELPCTLQGPSGPVPIFNFNRPDRYAELFVPAMWHDLSHLSPLGAKTFSKLLAGEVSAWLDGAQPTGCGG
jgi:hypothetical protein